MKGLIITLKKRKINSKDVALDENSFFVWGYYDVVTIEHIDGWKDFLPKYEISSEDVYDSTFPNEFHIKLIYPEDTSDIEDPDNLIYFGQDDINSELFAERPLLSIVLLHFTKDALEGSNISNLITKVMGTILTYVKDIKLEDRPIFAVYPTIGFMDAVIVSRSNNFATISNLVYFLRAKENLIDASYTLPSIYAHSSKKALESWKNCDLDKKTRISIRATLEPGVFANDFFNECKDEMLKLNYGQSDMYYKMFGNSDVMISPRKPLAELIPIYLDNDTDNKGLLFQPPFRGYLRTVRASIRVLDDIESGPTASTNDKQNVADDKYERKARENSVIISDIKRHISNGGNRLITKQMEVALLTLVNFYFDVTNSSHTFDIRKMIDPALENLVKNLEMANSLQEEFKNDKEEHKKDRKDKLNESLSRFTASFDDIISDFMRSDRYMFEGRWMCHPSVGSSSKLIMAYNGIASKIVELFPSKSTYTFLTVSGYVDHIHADLLFKFIMKNNVENDEIEKHRLIILHIPEMSLFDISYTIFQIAHEAFHHVSKRHRRERNKWILESMAEFLSISFKRSFWDNQSGYCKTLSRLCKNKYLRDQMKPMSENKTSDDLESKMVNIGKIIMKKISSKVDDIGGECTSEFKKICLDSWENQMEANPPKSQYSYHWEDAALENIDETLNIGLLDVNKRTETVKKLDELNKDFLHKLLHELNALIVEGHPHKRGGELEDDYKHDLGEVIRGSGRGVICYLRKLQGYESDFKDVAKYNPKDNQEFITIEAAFGILNEVYRETFADLCSVLILDSSIQQYMGAFHADFKSSSNYKNKVSAALRIGSILEVKFKIADAGSLREKWKSLFSERMIGDKSNNEFISTVCDLMKIYSDFSHMAGPLKKYLVYCKKNMEANMSANGLEKQLQDIRRLYSSTFNSMNDSGEIDNAVVLEIIEQWRRSSIA